MEQDAAPESRTASAREEPEGMDAEAALLAAFAAVPSVGRGWCFPSPDGVRVSLQVAQRNLPANAQRKYLLHFPLNEAVLERGALDASLPLELRDVLALAPSPSGDKTVVVRGGNGDTAAVLEVWGKSGGVLAELHVPKALHGAVYNDGWFGSGLAWSPDESRVAYVAEAPASAKTPEWGVRVGADGKKYDGAGPKGWRGVGEWQEDWGELNAGKKVPAIFVLDLPTREVLPVGGLPADASCGQPVWTPEGDGLVFVAWDHQASNFPNLRQRLGIVFCFNRPCALHAVPWPQAADPAAAAPLTPRLRSAFSPRFSPSGATLAFLSQQAAVDSGVHSGTVALHALAWAGAAALDGAPAPAPRAVVDVVWSSAGDAFPGLYCSVLPDDPWVGEDTLVLTTQWHSAMAVVAVDMRSGEVTRATPANGSSWSLVASGADWLVVSESRPSQPFALYAAHVTPRHRDEPHAWGWSRLALDPTPELPPAVRAALPLLRTDVLRLEAAATDGGAAVPYEAVVLYSKGGAPGPRPTVITPHGGPHTAYSAQFFMPLAYLASLGYAVVLINYRGSTGYGEASIQSLPGFIGTNDVADCLASLQAAVDKGYADPARVAVVGGSHGGFLTGNLVGQRPGAFRCAALRNPVCDLSLMVHVSDIPDWCYVESWGSKEGLRRAAAKPSSEDAARFLAVSPAAHVDAVACPMLFLLGAKDRRVPYQDALQYIAALRRRGTAEVRALVFPEDTHSLDRPQTDYEQWLNVAWWLKRHMA